MLARLRVFDTPVLVEVLGCSKVIGISHQGWGCMAKMLHSQELSDLPPCKRLPVLSRAYVGGSSQLCRALLAGDYRAEFASSRVVLHLCRHGVELFLKGAIHCATGNKPR